MKKLLFLIVAIVVLGLIVSGCLPVVPPAEKDEAGILTKAPKVKPPSGAHYNLNIIGKKSDWSGGGSYDNPNRHTMFVPENTDEFELNETACSAPEPDVGHGKVGPGITIWMTSCDNKINGDDCDFAVLDGNAFDDCKCEFQLAPGKYEVWIVAKAKPGGNTDITGWLYDPNLYPNEVFLKTDAGTINVKSSGKDWTDATDLFYYEGQWVFDYLQELIDDPDLDPGAYFWQFDNKGNKLVKVRFYKVK